MISITEFLALSAVAVLIYYIFFKDVGKKFPKGPRALPLIGNMLDLRGDIYRKLGEWADKYGDVYQVWFGGQRLYVINDLKLMKQVYSDLAFNDRLNAEAAQILTGGPHGITNSLGQEWVEQRRFSLRHLRDFGFGKMQGEEMIMNEVNEFLGKFSDKLGEPVVLSKNFQMSILNVLWQIMAGERYEQDDPRLWSVFHQNKKFSEALGRNFGVFFMPKLAKMFPNFTGWSELTKLADEMKAITMGHVERHRKTFPEGGVPRDFIDAYLKEIDATTDPQSSFYKENGLRSLSAVVGELFLMGFDSTTMTLSWAILYLVTFPEVQKKVQEELDAVVGRDRGTSLADRPLLPYVEATIAETLRYSSVVSFGPFHAAAQDTKLLGYDVPKGTLITSTPYRLHFDEKHFPNPKKFDPSRFISADGKFQKPEALMAFGFGKRACPGETLARDQIFLYLTNIFHRYNIRLADENPNPGLEPLSGFILPPPDFKVVMTARN